MVNIASGTIIEIFEPWLSSDLALNDAALSCFFLKEVMMGCFQ